MRFRWRQWSRKLHLWGALVVVLPVLIVIISGLLLQVKKQIHWIQPPTQKGIAGEPVISFDEILLAAKKEKSAEISSWKDIDRLDVRPIKGIIKIQSHNKVEIQIDSATGQILQVAQRRSDLIESLHDGSWFFEGAKLFVFLPAAIILLIIWLTGFVLLTSTFASRLKKKRVRSKAIQH